MLTTCEFCDYFLSSSCNPLITQGILGIPKGAIKMFGGYLGRGLFHYLAIGRRPHHPNAARRGAGMGLRDHRWAFPYGYLDPTARHGMEAVEEMA